MITTTSTMDTALQSNNRLWNIKVQITRNDSGATSIDISDRVTSCDIAFDFEKRSASASLELDNFDYSLSPLNMSSTTNQVGGVYNPLLDAYHKIQIWYGILTTNGYEYIQKFTGLLGDEIDADSYPGTIQITARDMSKMFQDTFIYMSKSYSALVVEQVIQSLIDEFLPSSGITVNVADATNFMVGRIDGPYTAQNTNLWDAVQTLADACNHELRFLEDGTLRIKKVINDVATMTAVTTIYANDMTKDSVSVSDSDVRNDIMLRVQGLDPIEKKNDDSVARYGLRYMEVRRSMADLITTAEQANQLLDYMLRELSYANPIDNFEMPLYPIYQIGDIVKIEDDNLGIDTTTYMFRITSTKDSIAADKKRTTVSLQGFTAFTAADSRAPKPITGFSNSFITRTIQSYPNCGFVGNSKTISYPMLQWTPPTEDVGNFAITAQFGGYSIYRKISTDSIWSPIASVKSYIQSLNLQVNYFYDYTAESGKTYDYKIVCVNQYGKASSDSSILTLTVPADQFT